MKNNVSFDFKHIALIINTCMTVIHFMLCLFFFFFNIRFMFFFNIASVTVYLLCYVAVQKEAVRTYVGVSIAEVLTHMTAAVICCGWAPGFWFYSFGMIVVLYFTKYLYATRQGFKHMAELITAAIVLIFVFLRVYTLYVPPHTPISSARAEKILYTANAVFILITIWGYLYFYTKTAIVNESDLVQLAELDELTKLYNRRKMLEVITECRDGSESKKFITMFDIDDFKKINDSYGHDAGDYVLRTISSFIAKACKEDKHATPCRWGGEEFLVAHEISALKKDRDGELLIRRICNLVKRHDFCYASKHMVVTLTAGVALVTPDCTVEEAIKKADENLYFGKKNGKNQVVFK